MPAKKISLKIEHPIEVGNVDVVFEVREGNTLLGKLKLSKGGLDWLPNNARRARKATWNELDVWMRRGD